MKIRVVRRRRARLRRLLIRAAKSGTPRAYDDYVDGIVSFASAIKRVKPSRRLDRDEGVLGALLWTAGVVATPGGVTCRVAEVDGRPVYLRYD